MNAISFSIIAALLVGVPTITDPIDKFVADCSSTAGWEFGLGLAINLPETASPETVVAAVPKRQFGSYKILEVKRVHIKGGLSDLYTLVLLKTEVDEKIVIISYKGGWNLQYVSAK